jgi:hypothetical protein
MHLCGPVSYMPHRPQKHLIVWSNDHRSTQLIGPMTTEASFVVVHDHRSLIFDGAWPQKHLIIAHRTTDASIIDSLCGPELVNNKNTLFKGIQSAEWWKTTASLRIEFVEARFATALAAVDDVKYYMLDR